MPTSTNERSALEILQRARETILDPKQPFDFGFWEHCACGHVYAAAEGDYAPSAEIVARPERGTRYAAVLVEIVEALGMTCPPSPWVSKAKYAANAISGQVNIVADLQDRASVERGDAVVVLDRAIEALREEDLERRAEIIERATAIIEAAMAKLDAEDTVSV